MKQRAIKRCVKRAMKAVRNGRKGLRTATVTPAMNGAHFVGSRVEAAIRVRGSDVQYLMFGEYQKGHAHWFYNAGMIVAVSYA